MSSSKVEGRNSPVPKDNEGGPRPHRRWVWFLAVAATLTAVTVFALFFRPDQQKTDIPDARAALAKAVKEKRPRRQLSLVRRAKRRSQHFTTTTGELLWCVAQLLEHQITQDPISKSDRETIDDLADRVSAVEFETEDLLISTLICAQTNETELGLVLADSLIEHEQPRDEILKTVAMMRFQAGKYDAAIQVCKELTQQFPDDPLAWDMLLSIYEGRGHRLQLIDIYEKLISIKPHTSDQYRTRLVQRLIEVGDVSRARNEYEQLQNEASADAPLLAAQLFFLEGNFDEALKQLTGVLETDPANLQALVLLGRIQLAQARSRDAINTLLQVLDASPQHREVHYLLSRAYVNNDQPKLAAKHARIHEQLHSAQKQGARND
ncbi:tetratricopeptide repeat protein [Thalassoroseus pseudoceratinae]|uniref:tetratricopeptide repeat protein n=1 Tax=Thalassoroseus pseudoceratinae TaxID=2713176 RepID=UPI001420E82F|nr:tetratricopeptide repeat protein [Thalassoroseus pseudoceratinae]